LSVDPAVAAPATSAEEQREEEAEEEEEEEEASARSSDEAFQIGLVPCWRCLEATTPPTGAGTCPATAAVAAGAEADAAEDAEDDPPLLPPPAARRWGASLRVRCAFIACARSKLDLVPARVVAAASAAGCGLPP
jgi:hypothetical protein